MSSPAAVPAAGEGQWQRLHPLTPFVRGWKVVAALLVVIGQQRGGELVRTGIPSRSEALITLAVIVATALLGGLYAVLAWRRARYRVGADSLQLRTGVLFRHERAAQLDRLQAVDVVRPLLARFFGLAELSLEVAGGGDSSIRLSLLREADAQALRSTLLARAAGLRFEGDVAPQAPERAVLEVSVGRLVESLVRDPVTVLGAALVTAAVLATIWFHLPAALAALLPIGLGLVGILWSRFTGGFGFIVATSPDGIRLHHGLLTTRSQTVPPGRVQALRLRQPLLWRGRDWWRVEVNVAGYGAGRNKDEREADEHLLLTVGTRAEALLVVSLVLTDPGSQSRPATYDDLSAELIQAGLTGRGSAAGFLSSPPRARLLDPIGWRRHGVRVTASVLLARRGVFRRELDIVPHERTQSLALLQGPLQRRLGVATFVLHSTRGPVTPRVQHLPALAAAQLLHQQAERATSARSDSAHDGRWMLGR